MSPSQEVLASIENRLRELRQEIAGLQRARSELRVQAEVPRRHRAAGRPGKPAPPSRRTATSSELTEEEWVARRAVELAAQSRAAA